MKNKKLITYIIITLVLILTVSFIEALCQERQAAGTNGAPQTNVKWIDVHNHFVPRHNNFSEVVNAAASDMDKAGILLMVVMPTPQNGSQRPYDWNALIAALRQYPGRFAFLGGGDSLNIMIHQAGDQAAVSDSLRNRFKRKAEEILQLGASGFGEIAIQHLSLHGAEHPYESVPADHPLLLLLADIAAEYDVPIDIHFDIVTKDMPPPTWLTSPNNPSILHANLAAFERFLDYNPKAKICWEHLGSDNTGHWTAELSRKLLQKHPNLYMSFRLGPGMSSQNYPLASDGKIKPEWLSLLQDFPARFMIGSDRFISSGSAKGGGLGAQLSSRIPLSLKRTPAFLNALPADLARKIAYENAISFYKLKITVPPETP